MTTGSSLVPLDTSTSLQQQHLQKCAPIRVRLNAGWCCTACVVVVFLVNPGNSGQTFFLSGSRKIQKMGEKNLKPLFVPQNTIILNFFCLIIFFFFFFLFGTLR